MIAQIEGKIISLDGRSVVVNVGGIGYRIFVTTETRGKTKEGINARFLTHLRVREDALELFGFEKSSELDLFEMLISISGIGPRSAISILSIASVETLKKAIGSGDTGYLTKVSGIGRKTAEKIVLELKEKLLAFEDGGIELRGASDALEALISLGYSQSEARMALKKIPEKTSETGARVKEALKILSNGS